MSKREAEFQATKELGLGPNTVNNDQPQRATAAQLASRKIKQIRGGSRPRASSPSMQPNGNAFGSVNPAPSQPQQPPFNMNNAPAGGQNGFSFGFGQQQSNSFPSSSQNNNGNQGFGGSVSTSFGGFGNNSGTGFNFAASTPAAASNPFQFGASSNSSNSNGQPNGTSFTGFSAGGSFANPSSQTSSASQPASQTTSIFSSAPQNNNSFGGNSSFGATSSFTSQAQTPDVSMDGAPSPQKPMFGAANGSTPAASNMFGGTTSASTPSKPLFAAASSAPPSGFNLFGATASSSDPAKPMFSATSSAAPSGSNLFGTAASSSTPSKPLFPTASSAAPTASSLFGETTSTSTPSKPMFSATSSATPSGSNLFGAAASSSTPSKPMFSATSNATPASSTLFGTATSSSTPLKPVSATTSGATTTGSSLFGTAKRSSTPAKPLFAATTSSTPAGSNPFGASTPTEEVTKPAFPTTPAAAPSNLFGGVKASETPAAPSSSAPSFGTPKAASSFGMSGSAPAFGTPKAAVETPAKSTTSNMFAQSFNAAKPAASLNMLATPSTPYTPKVQDSPAQQSARPVEVPKEVQPPTPAPTQTPKPATASLEASPKPAFNFSAPSTSTEATPKPAFAFPSPPASLPIVTPSEGHSQLDGPTQRKLIMLNSSLVTQLNSVGPGTIGFEKAIRQYLYKRDQHGCPVEFRVEASLGKRKAEGEESDATEQSQKRPKTAFPSSISGTPAKPPAAPAPKATPAQAGITPNFAKDAALKASQTANIFSQSLNKSTVSAPSTLPQKLQNTPAKTPAPSFQVPKFGTAAPATGSINFAAQFQKKAADTEAAAAKKRMADELDSDDSDYEEQLAEFKEKEEAEKAAKKAKYDGLSKAKVAFDPKKGFAMGGPTDSPKSNGTASTPAKAPAFAIPKFGAAATGGPVNFAAQFQNKAAKAEEAERKKRQADELDSDDSDYEEQLAEFKQKEEEERAAKKAKYEALAKTKVAFDPKKGFQMGDASKGAPAEFSKEVPKAVIKDDLPDYEDEEASESVNAAKASSSSSGSLFGRVTKPAESANLTPETPKPFSNLFGTKSQPAETPKQPITTETPKTNMFGNTFNTPAPLFGGKKPADSTSAGSSLFATPKQPITAETPKTNMFGNTFNTPGTGLFGSTTPAAAAPAGTGLFGSKTPAGTGLFGSSSLKAPTPAAGASVFSHLSNNSSAAPSTATSENASAAEDTEDDAEPKLEQKNFAAGGIGEENEESLHEVRAKATKFDNEKKTWASQGVGVLRLLRNKDTSKVRMLLRMEPSGNVILNTFLSKTLDYTQSGPNVKFPLPVESGKMETWALRVKTADDAATLASKINENKA